jgi:transcriptional regulator with XRE-family HTH domain
MTPAQCRAARALLGITQSELAGVAGLGLSTIIDFEKGRRRVSDATMQAMQDALERAGVAFNASGVEIAFTQLPGGLAEPAPILSEIAHVGLKSNKKGLLSSAQIRAARALLR